MPEVLNESKRPPLARSLEFSTGLGGLPPNQNMTWTATKALKKAGKPRNERKKSASALGRNAPGYVTVNLRFHSLPGGKNVRAYNHNSRHIYMVAGGFLPD
jgi:hypothetical protein